MSCYDGRLPPTRTATLIALHAAVLLFGLSGLFGKWLDLPPVLIVLGRTAVAAAALAAVRAFQRGPRLPFEPRLIGNGVLLALHWFAFFEAIRIASVAIGLLGYASFPLFVLVLERMLLGRRWSRREAATAVLVTGGLVLLVPELSVDNPVVQGLAWGLVCGFTFALLAVVNRSWSAGRPAIDIAFWQNFWAALALLPLALAAGPVPRSGPPASACCWCWASHARPSRTRCSSRRCAASPPTRRASSPRWSPCTGSRSRCSSLARSRGGGR